MAALDAAMMVKSFPVIPSRTSLDYINITLAWRRRTPYMMIAVYGGAGMRGPWPSEDDTAEGYLG